MVIVEGLGEDGHIHSCNSVFPGAQLDSGRHSECHGASYCVIFASGEGCPQNP